MRSGLRIGEVAELFDVSTKTLRHYEELGLVAPERAENGYREYRPEDVLRLQRVRQLQTLGLSLKQIRDVLERQDDAGLWTTVLRSLRDEVEAEIRQLEERKERLERLLADEEPAEADAVLPIPEKVAEFLEEHLVGAEAETWRHDQTVMAVLGGTQPAGMGMPELAELLFGPLGVRPARPGGVVAIPLAVRPAGQVRRDQEVV